jgi:hypothetical protein
MFKTKNQLRYIKEKGFNLVGTNTYYHAPGYSTVYKFGEEDWSKNLDKTALDKAIIRGNSLDECLECYFSGLPIQEECKPLVESINPVLESIGSNDISQEVFLYGKIKGLNVLGFSDAITKLDYIPDCHEIITSSEGINPKELILIDWKTKKSSNYNPSYLGQYMIQTSVYCRLVFQYYGILIKQACVVISFSTGEPCHVIWVRMEEMKSCIEIFSLKASSYIERNRSGYWKGEYQIS